ncbi:hypothetical protein KO533_10190 [Shewanella sp. NKUCC05_KAH]|jgi:hypothetical protein|uniref:Uncharacterized protein n=1 Tax=Shewanella oncorhynchi TaxID=2726434 RepID=A0AA50KF24_9GAMM|nr:MULTISPECIES: hypothetical protein [Shewanella]MBP8118202.1 hypothetical protein [Shewanella sp.]GCF88463.1 hypothetical protein SMBr_07070 [Shewanella sp. M-Br]MBW3526933.1 hypothetical protein [Shewanella sp. NKUCC05_KAH]MCU7964842.1 hypothetical protein [Shewanella sp. SW32]MCU7972767.1 hypothetical protein [Shewanella sp. SW29]
MDMTPISNEADMPKRTIKLDNTELIKTSFWVSQIFIIIATVVGVYLAAQEGLSQAIKFDALSNMQNNYHLRHALYDEVSDNVEILSHYADTVETVSSNSLVKMHPQMGLFVWDNMRYSANALETPSDILSDIRRLYLESEKIISNIETRHYSVSYGKDQLQNVLSKIKEDTLPKLKTNYETLSKELKDNDIAVD